MTVTVTINLSIELRIFLENKFQVISVALDAVCDISVQFVSFLHKHQLLLLISFKPLQTDEDSRCV